MLKLEQNVEEIYFDEESFCENEENISQEYFMMKEGIL